MGELSLIVLKDGKPLKKQNFSIFKLSNDGTLDKRNPIIATTDEDGYFFSKIPSGKYQIQLLARDKGIAQAFVKKNVTVKDGKESQIIISLKKDNSLSFIDAEAPKEKLNSVKKEVKKSVYGSLLLTLVSAEDKKKINDASIFVKGLNTEAKSDKNGFAELNLPVGEHTLSIIHQDFSAQTIKINILEKEAISIVIELTPSAMELEEFIVLVPHIEGSITATIAEERNSDAVGNVLGSEQFSKSGDSSVASALKRVSGITIVGGKYVYVRGLGDRYSTVMLNNLHIPSPEPTKRVVPLDIFPTSVVESITIQKSYTGDLPASFGGGTVLIKSKDIPKDEDGYVKLGLEVLANDSTGKKVTGNSYNNIPITESVISEGNNVNKVSTHLQEVINSRKLDHEVSTVQPGYKLELSAGKSFILSDNLSIGASATIYNKKTYDSDTINFNKYSYDINNLQIVPENNSNSNIYTIKTELGGMVNLGANYYKNNKIKYTYFTTNKTSDRTITSSINYYGDNDDREKTYYEYVTKSLNMNQLTGQNDIRFSNSTDGYFDNLKIDWAWESAKATRDEPGTIEYNYLHQSSGLNWDRQAWYYYFILDDTVNNYRADFSLPFKLNDNDNYTKIGYFNYTKQRNFDSRRYKMQGNSFGVDRTASIDTIYENSNTYGLTFTPSYFNVDSYVATQDVTAFYIKQLISVTHNLDLIASIRQEESKQQLTDASQAYDPLKTSDLFPSFGLTYRFDNDDMQLRFAYSQSISRPDFREFSSNVYLDPISENQVFGNPDLKATYINHLDLKYEWYLSSDELFSVALFSKEFINPIEKVIRPDNSQGGIFQETYQNADSAMNYGVEVDFRKRFSFIYDDWDKLLFATNVAYIQSNIKLNTDPNNTWTSALTSKNRAMQGQSPYVVNLTLGYDDSDTGNSALLLFNQIGESIVSLGTYGNKDIYKQAFSKLDFVLKWKLSPKKDGDIFAYDFRFKAENILDSELQYTQGGLVTMSTKPGRYYSLKLDIKY
jgi:hypothetical protein